MRRACRPSPAWLRWALPVCAAALLAPRPAVGQCPGPSFEPFAGPTVAGDPWGVAVGDFDRDGLVDAVVTEDLGPGGQVRFFKGDGTGGLTPTGPPVPVGLGPTDVVAADFDRDGLLDLAVANTGATTLTLLRGTAGGLVPAFDLDVGGAPSRLVVADFDRDGEPDLAVVSELGGTVAVYLGTGSLATPPPDRFTAFSPGPTVGGTPSAAVAGDFNRDGNVDLAVTVRSTDSVEVFFGDGTGHLGDSPTMPYTENPAVIVGVGTNPVDIAAGYVDGDGWLDLVTADNGDGAASVLIGDTGGTFNPVASPPAVGGAPARVALADFDRDGRLDLGALIGGGTPQVTVVPGTAASPYFEEAAAIAVTLDGGSVPRGLSVGHLRADGRLDLVATEGTVNKVVVAKNDSLPVCARSSFLDAPRAFPGGNGPVSVAVADLDEDGIDDMVAAAQYGGTLELLKGTGNGYTWNGNVTGIPTPRGVAAIDFDVNGNVDVAVAAGTEVRIYPGNGDGTLGGIPWNVGLGAAVWALVAGDFNEDGAPDVAAVTQGPNRVWILRRNNLGLLVVENWYPTGGAPRSLATGPIDAGTTLDIVVANSAVGGGVTILLGNGDWTFNEPGWSPYDTTQAPWSVALADFDGDTLLDLVTADWGTSRVGISPWNDPTPVPGFEEATFLSVAGQPIAVAALDVTGNTHADVMAVTGDLHTLWFREGNGNLSFQPEASHPVRTRPSSIAPIDADADGRPDLAIPCRDADSIVVLLERLSGFARAPTVSVGNTPKGVAAADLDHNGSVDLVVANSADDTVTVLDNDGTGVFTPRAPVSVLPAVPVPPATPNAVVVADFDRNGVLDLATANKDSADVSVLFGVLTPVPGYSLAQSHAAGTAPHDLVVADFDRDGDPDIAVCNKVSPGQITFLENDGGGDFTPQVPVILTPGLENEPVSIVSADFNLDGWPDVAVSNDNTDNLTVLYNDRITWNFPARETLPLTPGDTSPVSLAAGDFDDDGDADLVTVTSGSHILSLYRNDGGTFLPVAAPLPRFDASHLPLFVTAADLNRDGKLDAAIAAEGMKVLRGRAGLDFEPSEDVIAGRQPNELAIGDFNRDGRPDVAATNELSNDVSILLSSACLPRRLVLGMSPLACGLGAPPYPISATVRIEDDGGNVAICKNDETIHAAIVPGTGALGAVLGGTVDVLPTLGVASFGDLTIDRAGPRYQLEFELPAIPKVFSRSFTLGASVAITGPPSLCSSALYTADPGFDSYHWTLTPSPMPERFGPSTTVSTSDGLGAHTLDLVARVDGCAPTDSKAVYVGDLLSVTIAPGGPVTVCVDCLGGPVTVTEIGGGNVTRQWGYRTAPGPGAVMDIDGQIGDTYVINGQDFPDVGVFYLVVTTTPECGTEMTSNEVAVTITETVPGGEVRSLGVTSRGPGGVGEHVLQWRNTTGSVEENLVRWNKASDGSSLCSPPPDTLAPFDGEQSILSPPPLSNQSWTNNGVVLDTAYCYSVFVRVSGSYSPGRTVKARAVDTSSGPVRWNYATGATAVVAPTVSFPSIVVMSNDRSIHALERGIGPLSGMWAPSWTPPLLNGVAHMRSPVVPFVVSRGVNVASDKILFAGDDTGQVLAVNAATGQFPWAAPELLADAITGAPGGLFAQWNGGPPDVIIVGTRTGSAGLLYTLNVDTGDMIHSFNAGGTLGPILGAPAVDYANDRVYFTSWSLLGTNPSVWCVELSGTGMISACPLPWSAPNLGDIDASPVLFNGRLYVANLAGEVYSVNATTGAPGLPALTTSDGPVKGFLFPDRRGNDLYFATGTKVWSVRDTAGVLSANWTWTDTPGPGIEPSILLHWPETSFLYVGSKDGRLIQLDFSGGPPADPCSPPSCYDVVLGDGTEHIGAPTLDIGSVPPVILAGSESGAVHAVVVPLP